nr:hypothetical protein CFP56_53619 [Quercus suber]
MLTLDDDVRSSRMLASILHVLFFSSAVSQATRVGVQASTSELTRRAGSINNGVDLKILPLGASITFGTDSSDGNGYRLALRNMLENNGNKVGYVGTLFHGSMTNNAMEGFPSNTIAMVDNKTSFYHVYDFLPNVILLNVGTDDCNLPDEDPQGAPARYETFLGHIKDHVPDALVVVSNLIHNGKPAVDDCVATLGKQIQEIAIQANATGQKVAFADMYDAVTTDYLNQTDLTHPTDQGYKIMAQQWYNALVGAGDRITSPDPKGKAVPSAATHLHFPLLLSTLAIIAWLFQ